MKVTVVIRLRERSASDDPATLERTEQLLQVQVTELRLSEQSAVEFTVATDDPPPIDGERTALVLETAKTVLEQNSRRAQLPLAPQAPTEVAVPDALRRREAFRTAAREELKALAKRGAWVAFRVVSFAADVAQLFG